MIPAAKSLIQSLCLMVKDQVLMEAVGEVLQQMMWESVAAKVGGPE